MMKNIMEKIITTVLFSLSIQIGLLYELREIPVILSNLIK